MKTKNIKPQHVLQELPILKGLPCTPILEAKGSVGSLRYPAMGHPGCPELGTEEQSKASWQQDVRITHEGP